MARNPTASAPDSAFAAWFEAFNLRDLDRMLAGMRPDVHLYPLRLGGLDASYRGHDGIRRWFGDMDDHDLDHRVSLAEIRVVGSNEVLGIGELEMSGGLVSPFWARDLIEDGLIAVAHHYLTDPAVADGESLPPLTPAQGASS